MDDNTTPPDPDLEEAGESPEVSRPDCLNCGKKLPKKAKFCPRCGQRNNQGKVSMKELLQRFWTNFSHLDSKFIKICWQLFIPARVTLEYFRGRQKRYPNPVQFFLIVMFFFLLAVKLDTGKTNKASTPVTIRIDSSGTNKKVDINVKPQLLYPVIEKYVTSKEFRHALDSLSPELNTPVIRQALDSLMYITNAQWYEIGQIWLRDSTNNVKKGILDSIPLTLGYFVMKVSADDLVKLEPQEIAEKYGIQSWLRKTLLIQGIKSFKNPEGLARHYLGSLTWTLLALVSCMSLVLVLLYRRQKRFFVEHFVFLLHVHSAVLLLLAIILVLEKLTGIVWLLTVPVLFTAGYLLAAMKRFYGQSRWKTLLKWMLFGLIYFIGFVVFFLGGLMVVILLF